MHGPLYINTSFYSKIPQEIQSSTRTGSHGKPPASTSVTKPDLGSPSLSWALDLRDRKN